MSDFDPSGTGIPGNLFGLPYDSSHSEVVIIPVPWDVTVSYGAGTAHAPQHILEESYQLDHSIPGVVSPWELKVSLDHIDMEVNAQSEILRPSAEQYIRLVESGSHDTALQDRLNMACTKLERKIYNRSKELLSQGIIVGCLGGDHSTPLGLINALAENTESFGILQIDAHMDLRDAYEGLSHSHASIMRNALLNENIDRLVQVGIRDYCAEESNYIDQSSGRVSCFYDQDLKEQLFRGVTWSDIVRKIVNSLPDSVYVSFDIDGLDPSLCPHTGTPVPGGMSFEQVTYLLKEVVQSGRTIVGFDLSEVCPGNTSWDAIVGARVLYQLCIYSGISQGKIKFEA